MINITLIFRLSASYCCELMEKNCHRGQNSIYHICYRVLKINKVKTVQVFVVLSDMFICTGAVVVMIVW